MKNCNCQQYTSVDLARKDEQDEANGAEEKGGRGGGGGGGGGRGHIVSLVMGYDLASRMVNFSVPATYHRMKAIWGLLQKLADKRMERIREMDNKMLTKEEKRVREHREKEAKEEIHPEHMHHLLRSRDSATDSVRTAPISVYSPLSLLSSPLCSVPLSTFFPSLLSSSLPSSPSLLLTLLSGRGTRSMAPRNTRNARRPLPCVCALAPHRCVRTGTHCVSLPCDRGCASCD